MTSLLAFAFATAPALAQEEKKKKKETIVESDTDLINDPTLALDPTAPSVASLPGGVTPSFGQQSAGAGDWRFDFHGFLTMPAVVGLNKRQDPDGDTSEDVLHAPPIVPEDLETFSHTGVVPTPYVQMNFSYGNDLVTANVQFLARQATVSTGFFDPPSQAGINDAYFTVRPRLSKSIGLKMHAGAFTNRYGVMGEFDEGRYGSPLIARVNGVGENIIATLALSDDISLILDQGFMAQSNRTPPDLTPDFWNDFADPSQGSSFVAHGHVGVGLFKRATIGFHYLHAFSADDLAAGTQRPYGSIGITGADARLSLGRFGHLYSAFSWVDADNAEVVGRIIEVLNAPGGNGLSRNYLGDQSGGNGSIGIVGAQYDLSIGRLVSYPVPFYGDGPDIVVSVFGILAGVSSQDDRFDGTLKTKWGAMGTYSLLSWLAASVRYDQVDPNVDQRRQSFAVISPSVIFRTDWQATDQLVLQYSRWLNGSEVTVRSGAPPMDDPTLNPDENVISLSASMWW